MEGDVGVILRHKKNKEVRIATKGDHRPARRNSDKKLLAVFRKRAPAPDQGELLHFGGVGDRDVYNITAPFSLDGRTFIAGRVEARDTESAETVFFVRQADGIRRPHPSAPTFAKLQDPCITSISGELVIGGVEFPVELSGRDTPG